MSQKVSNKKKCIEQNNTELNRLQSKNFRAIYKMFLSKSKTAIYPFEQLLSESSETGDQGI